MPSVGDGRLQDILPEKVKNRLGIYDNPELHRNQEVVKFQGFNFLTVVIVKLIVK